MIWAPPKWNRSVQQEGHLARKVWYFLGIGQELGVKEVTKRLSNLDYKDLGRPKLWKKGVSTWSLRESAASSLCVLQCPDLDRPHLSLVPTDLYSHRPSSQPWDDCQVCSVYLGFQAMHLMLFEDSRDPCRLLVTTAGSPSPVASPYASVPLLSPVCPLEMSPFCCCCCSPPSSPSPGLTARRLGHTAVHVSQALRRRGLVWSPSPATCRRGAGLQR